MAAPKNFQLNFDRNYHIGNTNDMPNQADYNRSDTVY